MAKSEREFVSVIIPTHRRAGLFGECLKSLSRQDYGQNNFEVIAVHDGMDCDYDERSLHRIAPKHFRFAKITRSGVAGARNCAISRAKGSLVMMLDDDCVAQKSWIRSYVSYMNKNNQVVASGGSVRSRKPKTIIQRYVALKRLLGRPIVDDDGRIASIIGANGCYRKAVLDNVDGFREDLSYSGGEDLDLSFRCRKIGPLGYCFLATVYHSHRRTLRELIAQHMLYGKGIYRFCVINNVDFDSIRFFKPTIGGDLRYLRYVIKRVATVSIPEFRRKKLPIRLYPSFCALDVIRKSSVMVGATLEHHRLAIKRILRNQAAS